MSRAHSVLGASSAFRWMSCPGSVRLSEGMPGTTSVAAEEGTAAHALAEHCLKKNVNPHDCIGQSFEDIEVTEEMANGVAVFVAYVRERPVDQFEVVDFKYGRGHPVEVEGNPQLLYYVLGALFALEAGDLRAGGKFYEVEFKLDKLNPPVPMWGTADAVITGDRKNGLRVTIVQPRAAHERGSVRTTVVSYRELLDFSEDLLDAARKTQEPDAPLVPGDQCRWCRAKPICPALHSKALEIAQAEFTDLDAPPPTLPTPEQMPEMALTRALEWKDRLKEQRSDRKSVV